MTTGWQTKKLGEILKLEYGKPLPNSKRSAYGEYPVYGANGERARSSSYFYDKPSIIIGRKGSAGELNLTEGKFWPLDVAYYVTFDEKKSDLKFLYNLLTTLDLPKLAKGVKPGLNRNEVYSIDVEVPVLSEQKRIVKKLDDIFEKVTKAKEAAEKNKQNSKELLESYLRNTFANPGKDWEKKELGELFQIGSSKRVLKSQWRKEGVPFFRGREITRLAMDGYVNNELFISEDHYLNLLKQSGVPKSGDIVITAIGTIGNTHVVRQDDRFYFKDASVLWMKKFTDVNSEFIKFWLKSSSFFNQLDSDNGATVDTLTIRKLQSVQLYIPSLSKQNEIVKNINAVFTETKKLEKVYKHRLANLEELKKSVLARAFTGTL